MGASGSAEDLCIQIAGLRIRVHGRQFDDAQDYWDGNWLVVSARCVEGGASVEVSGPIVHLSELSQFLAELEPLYETLRGTATLPCMEPNLRVEIRPSNSTGGMEVDVRITPDHLNQEHRFLFAIDQSYLPGIIGGIRAVLAECPIRGNPE